MPCCCCCCCCACCCWMAAHCCGDMPGGSAWPCCGGGTPGAIRTWIITCLKVRISEINFTSWIKFCMCFYHEHLWSFYPILFQCKLKKKAVGTEEYYLLLLLWWHTRSKSLLLLLRWGLVIKEEYFIFANNIQWDSIQYYKKNRNFMSCLYLLWLFTQ